MPLFRVIGHPAVGIVPNLYGSPTILFDTGCMSLIAADTDSRVTSPLTDFSASMKYVAARNPPWLNEVSGMLFLVMRSRQSLLMSLSSVNG